jgi:hypothetical protein
MAKKASPKKSGGSKKPLHPVKPAKKHMMPGKMPKDMPGSGGMMS